MPVLTKGTKVYIDGYAGLIAGVVVSMTPTLESAIHMPNGGPVFMYPSGATVKITAKTGRGYVRGELVVRPVSMVVPRECVRRRKYGTRILPYTPLV